MATEKLYIAKLESGEEIGPAEAEVLIKLAENGTITNTTMVRSKLIPDWNRAGNVDFLKAIIFKQQQEALEQQALGKSIFSKIRDRIFLVAPQLDDSKGVIKVKAESLPAAMPLQRLLAGLTDILVLAICLGLLFFGAKQALANGVLTDDNAVYITVPAMIVFVILYFTILISWKTQTIGQHFWGIFLIRRNGKPFWMGRVFFFACLLLIFGIFTPIFLIIGTRTYPEILTGTRLAKVPANQ